MRDSYNLDNTKKYIRLFKMQLHGVLEDMAKPAEQLSGQFSDSLLSLYDIREHLVDDDNLNREELTSRVDKLISQLFVCVSSMQFVDAKRQRIEHVADGLSYLIEIDESSKSTVSDWDDVKHKIQSQYKMDKERNIYKKYLQAYDTDEVSKTIDTAN